MPQSYRRSPRFSQSRGKATQHSAAVLFPSVGRHLSKPAGASGAECAV